MTEPRPEISGAGGGDAPRRLRGAMMRALVAVGIIVAGVAAMDSAESAFHLTFNKPPMPLQKDLGELSKSLGDPVRYVADATDSTMTEDTLEVLGTNQYLLRRYTDLSQTGGSPVGELHLNVNYYPRGSSTPHVPEICWAGAGMREDTAARREMEVKGVRRLDGRMVDLRMTLVSFFAPNSQDSEHLKNVAYLYAVNGDYVSNPREVISRFWRASNKYAYDAKIEVTVGDNNQFCSQAEAETAIAAYMRVALPELEKCLPDPTDSPGSPSKAGVRGGKE